MDAKDVNGWLAVPGGMGAVGVILWLWRYVSSTKLGVRKDSADGDAVESTLKASQEWMGLAAEADKRATVNFDLWQVERLRADGLAKVIPSLEAKVERLERTNIDLRRSLHDLATMMAELLPESAPFVRQWIEESGFQGFDAQPIPPSREDG